jgi:glycerate kinase
MPAGEVAGALATGFVGAGWRVDRCPLADGGEGTLDVLGGALAARPVAVEVHDALERPVEATIGLTSDGELAIVETAAAIGLSRIGRDERDPEAATSAGAGELIVEAVRRAPVVLVGLGGSASNDGGAGALAAIAAGGGIGRARLVCLCDVRTPWELASETYGPQKGAGQAAVARLAERLDSLAADLPRDPRRVPMTGAAGGLAGGLWAALSAELVPGAAYVCDAVGFDERATRANAVVTGEGRLDATSLEGKVVGEVARRCGRLGTPVHAVVGADASTEVVRFESGFASVTEAGDAAALQAAAAALAV